MQIVFNQFTLYIHKGDNTSATSAQPERQWARLLDLTGPIEWAFKVNTPVYHLAYAYCIPLHRRGCGPQLFKEGNSVVAKKGWFNSTFYYFYFLVSSGVPIRSLSYIRSYNLKESWSTSSPKIGIINLNVPTHIPITLLGLILRAKTC